MARTISKKPKNTTKELRRKGGAIGRSSHWDEPESVGPGGGGPKLKERNLRKVGETRCEGFIQKGLVRGKSKWNWTTKA